MAEGARERRAQVRQRVDKKIRIRLTILTIVFLVMLSMIVIDVVRIGTSALLPVLLCLAGGVAVGLVVSRMFHLGWDEASERVVGRIDVLGVVIIVCYIAFSIFRNTLVGLWVAAPVAGVAGLAVVAGVIFGQAFGTRQGVIRVFRILRGQQPA